MRLSQENRLDCLKTFCKVLALFHAKLTLEICRHRAPFHILNGKFFNDPPILRELEKKASLLFADKTESKRV